MVQRMTWLRKKLFEKFSSTLYFEKTKKKLKPTFKLSLNLSFENVLRLKQKRHYFLILIYIPDIIKGDPHLKKFSFFLDRNIRGNVWKWYIFNISYKVIQHKRAFLGKTPEPKLRPCSRNENSKNENKISHRQISKTVLIDLNIHRGELNTKCKTKENYC